MVSIRLLSLESAEEKIIMYTEYLPGNFVPALRQKGPSPSRDRALSVSARRRIQA
jgi:hypothetical protein